MSYRKAAEWLAGRFPSPDKPSTVRKLPERARASATTPTTFETVSPELATSPGAAPAAGVEPSTHDASLTPTSTSAAPTSTGVDRPAAGFSTNRRRHRSRVEPLATARFRVEFTASAELTAKLKLAADLMAHRNPSRDFEPIFEQALDLLIAKLEKQRFAETDRPAGRRSSRPETVTNDTRRAVLERDGLQCSFVDDQGRRCTARAFLERDHIRPRGKGGGSGPDNIRHLCRAHNQWLAEIEYGREHIERAKKAKQRGPPADATATSRTARSASRDGAPDTS
jgi:5-methylcytosine-specific restriction endonuclease McrA